MIRYYISAFDPKAHLFKVKVEIPSPQQPVQKLRLPNWIPGSYLIRDFSKSIIGMHAYSTSGEVVQIESIDKSNWSIRTSEAVTVEYDVYAWDLSVRGAHFDESHAFFNGTSTFIEVVGLSEQACEMVLVPSDIALSMQWQVATGMPVVDVNDNGFGTYKAENYQALIDYPVEMGTFTDIHFEANGIPHRMVLTGVFNLDEERLKADLIKICETELDLFAKPAPIESYLFQVMVTGNDYGGLEHRNSTALICSRNDLPYPSMTKATDGYLTFLELCSHEYFHTWNVKRIQPKPYQESDLQSPVYTDQLWWFEGITSYYDALILLRAGVIDQQTYLQLLAKQMTRVYRMPGRFEQSVAESSWLTWTTFYQQNENAPNAIISYYTKGSLIALALDLIIRKETKGKKSLDDILLHLWTSYGQTGLGLEDGQIESICSEISGIDFKSFFAEHLFGTKDFDFKSLFEDVGIDFQLQPLLNLDDLGANEIKSSDEAMPTHLGANLKLASGGLQVTHVWNNQPAYHAGLSAGDIIIALNDLRVDSKAQLERLLKRSVAGTEVSCHYFRRDEFRQTVITLSEPPADRVVLKVNNDQQVGKWLQPIQTNNQTNSAE